MIAARDDRKGLRRDEAPDRELESSLCVYCYPSATPSKKLANYAPKFRK
jgi:hypothetical protein